MAMLTSISQSLNSGCSWLGKVVQRCDSRQSRRDKKHLLSSWVQVRIPKAQQIIFHGLI